jgi:hypothetical protein
MNTDTEKRLRNIQEKFLEDMKLIVHDMVQEAIAGALSSFRAAPLPPVPKRRGRPPKSAATNGAS